jgi:sugar phosphate isomerase/epimerase
LPQAIDPSLTPRIREASARHGIRLAALSATFNLIDPDPERRDEHFERLGPLADLAASLGIPILTLCTGTQDADDMWRPHPANETEAAWSEMRSGIDRALAVTEASGVRLGIEPELGNVVNSARRARRLLDEVRSPRLVIVIDPANLFPAGSRTRQHEILREAFELLSPDIRLAHAKDIVQDGAAGNVAPGKGWLDFTHYHELLLRLGYDGPWILHGLGESEVGPSLEFMRTLDSRVDR